MIDFLFARHIYYDVYDIFLNRFQYIWISSSEIVINKANKSLDF